MGFATRQPIVDVTDLAAAEPEIAIEVKGVRKVYGAGKTAVEAVRLASITVQKGEFVSILGPSGCGKSTLLMIVAGLEVATAGQTYLNGREVNTASADVGLIFQEPTLLPWKTTLENIVYPIRLLGKPIDPYIDRARQLMDAVGLHGFADSRPRQLSGGMKQRAAICRALINDAPVLLMDEPFSALDAITRDEMNDLLLQLWQQMDKTALFITHSIREAVFLSDRIIVMGSRPSRIVADVPVPFKRPRDTSIQNDPAFAKLCRDLKTMIYPEGPRDKVLLPSTLFRTGPVK